MAGPMNMPTGFYSEGRPYPVRIVSVVNVTTGRRGLAIVVHDRAADCPVIGRAGHFVNRCGLFHDAELHAGEGLCDD
jgi:hypothetical protein